MEFLVADVELMHSNHSAVTAIRFPTRWRPALTRTVTDGPTFSTQTATMIWSMMPLKAQWTAMKTGYQTSGTSTLMTTGYRMSRKASPTQIRIMVSFCPSASRCLTFVFSSSRTVSVACVRAVSRSLSFALPPLPVSLSFSLTHMHMNAVPDRLDSDSDNDCVSDRKEGVPKWRQQDCTQVQDCDCGPLVGADSDGDGKVH